MKNILFSWLVKPLLAAFLLVTFVALPPGTGKAAGKGPSLSIIRDSEIEDMIKKWIEPVIIADRLDPEAVKIILVHDPAMNAFVSGGQNIFFFTGLLMKTQSASEVIGVAAHELGHISGGHLVRGHAAIESASYESILGTLLGIGAAVITGNGGVGAAVSAGARSTAINRFLAFSRVQESSADQAAIDGLEKAGMSPAGLVSFMEKLRREELLPADQQSEYMRTHPLTQDRIEALRAGLERSPYKDQSDPPAVKEQHARMIAKLIGFLEPEQVAWRYDSRDNSMPARYARTIAAYRQNRIDEAVRGMNDLVQAEPDNPFFWELKGQVMADFGRIDESLPAYGKAVKLYPKDPVIRTAYAGVLIESANGGQEKQRLAEAKENLIQALAQNIRSARAHRLLATVYGRQGDEPMAKLHLAQEALIKGEYDHAKQQAEIAIRGLKEGSSGWLLAQDILHALEKAGKGDKN